MKAGDMVRFKHPGLTVHDFPNEVPWHLGLLIEYHSWEKIATIMYEGRLLRIRSLYVQKAGKKDYEGQPEKTEDDLKERIRAEEEMWKMWGDQ